MEHADEKIADLDITLDNFGVVSDEVRAMCEEGTTITRTHLDGAYDSMISATDLIEAEYYVMGEEFHAAYENISNGMDNAYMEISALIENDAGKGDRF